MCNSKKVPIISKEMTVEANADNVGQIIDFVCEPLKEIECSEKIIKKIRLATEEIVVNINSYAYADSPAESEISDYITVDVSIFDNPKEITIAFHDSGIPFDPLEQEDPDITLEAKDRQPGGLGIFLTKRIMDYISYEYKNNQNNFIISKTLE